MLKAYFSSPMTSLISEMNPLHDHLFFWGGLPSLVIDYKSHLIQEALSV